MLDVAIQKSFRINFIKVSCKNIKIYDQCIYDRKCLFIVPFGISTNPKLKVGETE